LESRGVHGIHFAPQEDFKVAQWQLIDRKHPNLAQFALDLAAIPEMKSDLFEALRRFALGIYTKNGNENKEMVRIEQKIISVALKDARTLKDGGEKLE
jgi:hypothetical protein